MWPAAVAAALAALLVGGLAGPVVRRLPEPTDPDDLATKRPYATLAGARFALGSALAAGVVVGAAWLSVPLPARPVWVVLGTVGVLLAAIDASTTWLPLRLTRLGWAAMAAAGGVGLLLERAAGGEVTTWLGRTALGAALAGALFWLVWALTRGGFGFGDVRFAPLIGAAAGAVSLRLVVAALVLGSFVGGLYGVMRLLARRREPFPYAPSMLGGATLALGWMSLV